MPPLRAGGMKAGQLLCRPRARSRPAGRKDAPAQADRKPAMAEAKPLTAQRTEYEKGKLETPRDGGGPPPTATEHKEETPHIETFGQGARGTSPHAHCIGQRCRTRQGEPLRSVSGPAVHSRYRRQPVHGVQATRWIARAAWATVTAPKDAHRDGWRRARRAVSRPRR